MQERASVCVCMREKEEVHVVHKGGGKVVNGNQVVMTDTGR